MPKYRANVSAIFEVEADDPIQAEEDAAVALIWMVRNDEIAFNLYRLKDEPDGERGKE